MSIAPYIELISCCDTEIVLYFKLPDGFDDSISTYQYLGVNVNGLINNQCYTITTELGSISYVSGLPDVLNSDLSAKTGCDDLKCVCPNLCYTLYNCEGVSFNTNSDLSEYLNSYIRIEDDPNTWYVTLSNNVCNNPIAVTVDTESPITECTLKCYQVTENPSSVIYINSDYEVITAIGPIKTCSYILPIVQGNSSGYVVELGNCEDNQCPEICFKFTNCITGEELIVSNSPNIIPYYAQDQIVTLNGYDGCWSITISETCECPISVTILTSHTTCEECLPYKAYKFNNCNNPLLVKYSTDDYSAYVNKTVELECGECWFVTEINYVPPSTQPITILYTFDSCIACNKTYYELTNCADDTQVIYTDSTIVLNSLNNTNIGDCVHVSFVLDGVQYEYNVPKVGEFGGKNWYKLDINETDYLEIVKISPSFWQLFYQKNSLETYYKNTTDSDYPIFDNWTFYDGDLELTDLTTTFCVEPTIISIQECPGCFIVEETRTPVNPKTVTVIETYTTCEDCEPTPEPTPAPVLEIPKRFVKPGYFTPACNTEKYEKYACKSSEILYKSVLEKRYGISNCCPDTDLGDKWIVKKELADLQGAVDPNYICTPVQSCCNNTPSCDCGCNTTPRSCNSQ